MKIKLTIFAIILFSELNGFAQNSDIKAVYYYPSANLSAFMNVNNGTLADSILNLGFNSVFFFIKLSDDLPNPTNYGLKSFSTLYHYYPSKVKDFVAVAHQKGLKVFAFQIEGPDWVDYNQTAQLAERLRRIKYYQLYMLNNAPNSKFDGFVTNIEPWTFNGSQYLSSWSWQNLTSTNNIIILTNYMYRIRQMYDTINKPELQGSLFPFIGSVHWKWQKISQENPQMCYAYNYRYYIKGPYSNYKGFDILTPNTYEEQINNIIIDNIATNFPQDNTLYVGDSWQWFHNNILFLTNNWQSPIDAAPLIYGHTAAVTNGNPSPTQNKLQSLIRDTKKDALICNSKANYKGSVVFDYKRYRQLNIGNLTPEMQCSQLSDSDLINIFPNPFSNELNIVSSIDNITIRVYDQYYNLVHSGNNNNINTEHFRKNQFYYIHIIYNGNVIYKGKYYK